MLFPAMWITNSYLLDNLEIKTRKDRWANESRRNYVPKKQETISEYKPNKLTEYQKKFKKAEQYIIKAFKKEFKLDGILKKDHNNSWLKRPVSIKKNKRKIIIHHTAESFSWINNISWEITTIQRIYKFHTVSRWWWDIGYNYLIGPMGTIYEGRYWWPNAVWAHATRNNTESIGIALLGNFEVEKPTDAQITSLKKLLTAVSKKYKINPRENLTYHTFDSKSKEPHIHNINMDAFIGHKDVGDTSCPGKHLYELIPLLKRSTSKELGLVK